MRALVRVGLCKFLVYVGWLAPLLLAPSVASAQAPITPTTSSSPAAFQECILAVDKINKLRPNWLGTSYGDCRSASQCNTKNCQEEILRKQEYVERTAKERGEEQNTRSGAILLRASANVDPLSQALNYIGGYEVNSSKIFFYPLDIKNKKSACEIGLYDQFTNEIKTSRFDLGRIDPKTVKIARNIERNAKGFYSVFTSTALGLELPLVCKNCTQERLEKSWQSAFSICSDLKR